MAIQLSESTSVKLKPDRIEINMENLDTEGLGVVSLQDAEVVSDAYRENVVALRAVIETCNALIGFCVAKERAFKERVKSGENGWVRDLDRQAEKQYNLLPTELKW